MTVQMIAVSERVAEALENAAIFSTRERLMLAKLLLDTILTEQADPDADWMALGLTSFEKDWNNSDDAIYDNWQERFDVSEERRPK